jgi:hypothetical protein
VATAATSARQRFMLLGNPQVELVPGFGFIAPESGEDVFVH